MSVKTSAVAGPLARNVIAANIKWIGTTGAKLDAIIHATAVAILHNAKDTGQTTPALDLLKAMPKSGRAKALKAWFETMSPIRINADLTEVKLAGKADTRVWLIEDATDTPFWELNPEKDVQVFDLDKALNALLSRAAKQAKDGILTVDEDLTKRLAQVRKLVKVKA
jgi:phospholipase/lecithinase/hemolysin